MYITSSHINSSISKAILEHDIAEDGFVFKPRPLNVMSGVHGSGKTSNISHWLRDFGKRGSTSVVSMEHGVMLDNSGSMSDYDWQTTMSEMFVGKLPEPRFGIIIHAPHKIDSEKFGKLKVTRPDGGVVEAKIDKHSTRGLITIEKEDDVESPELSAYKEANTKFFNEIVDKLHSADKYKFTESSSMYHASRKSIGGNTGCLVIDISNRTINPVQFDNMNWISQLYLNRITVVNSAEQVLSHAHKKRAAVTSKKIRL